ncbi:unnamed protein product [Hydatigera taeniaeformis]|uniref:F-box domain-containing protein n=1 Tax=Hydatigena taeniaeformis TaxID=6205 RepID=A0A0R3WJ87_HYDTA|nr:unnamed protein product [Hydatigera taeniaeformis]
MVDQCRADHMTPLEVTFVRPDLALRICQFLDAPDLINACSAIQPWRWILTTRQSYDIMVKYISQKKWLDKQLSYLLFSKCAKSAWKSAALAVLYYHENKKPIYEWLHSPDDVYTFTSTRCCLVPHLDTLRNNGDVGRLKRFRAIYFTVLEDYSLRDTSLAIDFIETQDLNFTTLATGMDGRIRYTTIPTHLFCNSLRRYHYFIYVTELGATFNDDLIDLLGCILPHQVLIIAVLLDRLGSTFDEMNALSKLAESFGRYDESPLSTTSVNWRILLVRCISYVYLNVDELLQLADCDTESSDFSDDYSSDEIILRASD